MSEPLLLRDRVLPNWIGGAPVPVTPSLGTPETSMQAARTAAHGTQARTS